MTKPQSTHQSGRGISKLDNGGVISAGIACHHVAMRHMLLSTMTAKNTTTEEPARADAALVYRDKASTDRWLVGPPAEIEGEEQSFTGPNACQAALEFAHRHYGSARFFAG